MSLYTLLLIGFCCFALVHWWLLPRVERRIRVDRSAASIPGYVTVAGLHFIRTVLFLWTVSALLVVSVVGASTMFGGTTPEGLGRAIDRVQWLRGTLAIFSPGWSVLLTLLSVGALIVLARRNARKKVVGAFTTLFQEEFARVAATLRDGTAANLPADEAMQQLETVMLRLIGELEEVKRTGPVEKQAEIEQTLEVLAQQRLAYDVRRRMNLMIDPDQVLVPPPATLREKLETLFVSRGLLSSMRGSVRLLMYAGLLVMVPSLVSLQTVTAGAYFEQRIVALDELRVEASVREAEQAWDEAQGRPAPAPPPPPAGGDADAQALDVLSAEFEEALARAPVFTVIPRAAVSLRAHSVRAAIIRVRAERAVHSVESAPAAQAADDVTPLQREMIDDFERLQQQRGPRTEVGRRMRADLERIRAERPAVWERMRASARETGRSFQQAATTDDFGRFLTNRIIGVAMSDLPGDGPLLQAARELDAAVGHDAVRRLYRVKAAEYMTNLAAGRSVADAAHVVSSDTSRAFWTSGESERFSSHVRDRTAAPASLQSRPPTLVPLDEPHVNVKAAEDIVVDMSRGGRTSGTDALANFDDWFPSQQGRDQTTTRARVDRTIATRAASPGAIGSLPRGSDPVVRTRVSTDGARSFHRARSFFSLRGFSRIGGVLIGNDPTETPALDFRGFSWESTPAGMTLHLKRQDGRAFALGPYHPSIVHHALAYAADGRPVAVTMVTAAPLAELKILLHPALLDSPVGCRAIEIDRFVDRFSGRLEERRRAEQAVADQQALYEHAWALRFITAYEGAATDRESLATTFGYARRVLEDENQMAAAARAGADHRWRANPTASPLLAKSEYYDASLVKEVRECSPTPGRPLSEIDSCLTRRFKAASASYASESSRWFVPPPDTQVWSGVRELSYRLDPNLRFLSTDTADGGFAPLDFMLQVSFTSAPAFLTNGADPDAYDDQNPWEFPTLKSFLRQAVARGALQTAEDRDILQTMREFTTLQRFFRVALAERLGPGFPIERLPQLAKVTAPAASKCRTARWNAVPGRLEQHLAGRLASARRALQDMSATSLPARSATTALAEKIDRCVAAIAGALQQGAPPADGVWGRECSSSAEPDAVPAVDNGNDLSRVRRLDQLVSHWIAQTTDARRLRNALGVELDDRQARMQQSCPAL